MPSAPWQELPSILGTPPALGWGPGSVAKRTPLGSFTPIVGADADTSPISAKPTLGFTRQPLVVEEKPANRQRPFPFFPTDLDTSIQPKPEPATVPNEPPPADSPPDFPLPPAVERRPFTESRENAGPQFPDLPLPDSAKLRQKPLGFKRQYPEPPPPLGHPLQLPEALPTSDIAQPLPQPPPPALPRSPQYPEPANLDTTNRAGESFDESEPPDPAAPLQRLPELTTPQPAPPIARESAPTDQPPISPVPETADRLPQESIEESQAIQPAQEDPVAPTQTEAETPLPISPSPLESPFEELTLQPDEGTPETPTVQANEDVSALRSPPTESSDSTNQPTPIKVPDVSQEFAPSSPSPSPPPLQPTRDESAPPSPPSVEEQSRSDLLSPSEEPFVSDQPSPEASPTPIYADPIQPAPPTDQQPQSPLSPPNLIHRVPLNLETAEDPEPSSPEAMDVAPEASLSPPETPPASPEFPDSVQEIADAPTVSPSPPEVEGRDIPEISPTEEILAPIQENLEGPVEPTEPSASDTPQPTVLPETPESDSAIQKQPGSPPSIVEDSEEAIPQADLTEPGTPSVEPQQKEPNLQDLPPAVVAPDPQYTQDLVSRTPEPQTFSPDSQLSVVNLEDEISEEQATSPFSPEALAIQPKEDVEEQESGHHLDSDINIQSRNTETSHLLRIPDIAEPPSSPFPTTETAEPPPEDTTPSLPPDPVTRLTRPLGYNKPLLQPKLPLMNELPTAAEPQDFQKTASPPMPLETPQLPGGEVPRAVTAATAPWQQQFQLEDSPTVDIPTIGDTGLPTPKSATTRELVETTSALATGPPVTLPGLKPQSARTQPNAEELELLARVLYAEWLTRQALSRAIHRGQWPAHSPWIADYRLNVTAEAPRNNIFDRQQWRSDLVTQAILEPSVNILFWEIHHTLESRLSCRGSSP
jgi:hypothetical protein